MNPADQYRLYESLKSFIHLREEISAEPDSQDKHRRLEKVQQRIEQIAAELYGKNTN